MMLITYDFELNHFLLLNLLLEFELLHNVALSV